jgi:hypothetical protein
MITKINDLNSLLEHLMEIHSRLGNIPIENKLTITIVVDCLDTAIYGPKPMYQNTRLEIKSDNNEEINIEGESFFNDVG